MRTNSYLTQERTKYSQVESSFDSRPKAPMQNHYQKYTQLQNEPGLRSGWNQYILSHRTHGIYKDSYQYLQRLLLTVFTKVTTNRLNKYMVFVFILTLPSGTTVIRSLLTNITSRLDHNSYHSSGAKVIHARLRIEDDTETYNKQSRCRRFVGHLKPTINKFLYRRYFWLPIWN